MKTISAAYLIALLFCNYVYCSTYKVTFSKRGVVHLGLLVSKNQRNEKIKQDKEEWANIVMRVCSEGSTILSSQKKLPQNPYSFIVANNKVQYCNNNKHNDNLEYKFLISYQLSNS